MKEIVVFAVRVRCLLTFWQEFIGVLAENFSVFWQKNSVQTAHHSIRNHEYNECHQGECTDGIIFLLPDIF